MRIRLAALALVLSSVPTVAHADRHFADLAFAPFLAQGSDYKGLQLSGSWPIAPCFDMSLVGTFGRFWGTESNDPADHRLATYFIGARWTFHELFGKEVFPLVQVLGGWVDNMRKIEGDLHQVETHKVIIFGAGIQPELKYWRLRLRLQGDAFYRTRERIDIFDAGGWGVAFSAGLVYEFGPEYRCEKDEKGKKRAVPKSGREKSSTPDMHAGLSGPPQPVERSFVGMPVTPSLECR
jgi:hypothetical protein